MKSRRARPRKRRAPRAGENGCSGFSGSGRMSDRSVEVQSLRSQTADPPRSVRSGASVLRVVLRDVRIRPAATHGGTGPHHLSGHAPMLTDRERAIVRETWAMVAPIAPTAASLFY